MGQTLGHQKTEVLGHVRLASVELPSQQIPVVLLTGWLIFLATP